MCPCAKMPREDHRSSGLRSSWCGGSREGVGKVCRPRCGAARLGEPLEGDSRQRTKRASPTATPTPTSAPPRPRILPAYRSWPRAPRCAARPAPARRSPAADGGSRSAPGAALCLRRWHAAGSGSAAASAPAGGRAEGGSGTLRTPSGVTPPPRSPSPRPRVPHSRR